MRWIYASLLLVAVLLFSVISAWSTYNATNREPHLLRQWVGIQIRTHEAPLTLDQRRAGIGATFVGISAAAALGVLFVLWFRLGRKLERRHSSSASQRSR